MENILVNTNESQWVWNSLPQTYERAHLEPLVSEQKSSFPVRETSSSHSEKRGCVTGRESEKEGAAGQTGFPEIQTHLQRHRGTVESMVTLCYLEMSLSLLSPCQTSPPLPHPSHSVPHRTSCHLIDFFPCHSVCHHFTSHTFSE